MEASESRIASIAADLMPQDAVVLTHSSSSAVRAALLVAHSTGKLRSVICTESQPMREGVELARSLQASGISATIILDAAMASVMERIDLAMVGADAVGPRDFTNKVGTLTLAHLCRVFAKPLYVLCGDEKFFPAGYEPPAPTGDFEAVARSLVTGIVTAACLQPQS
jgi:translation initiation factor 2B subunit (eIF-2B alpha/beta/delta family)